MTIHRLAVVVSHPIQYFAPWYRAIASREDMQLRVFFCCDWGAEAYVDPGFGVEVRWDIPLTEGYAHSFLPIARRPRRLTFWQVDNPGVTEALEEFRPDVVLVHGYAHRTNWRAASWAKSRGVPALIYSDSHGGEARPLWKRAAKEVVVRRFYSMVSGALSVGNNNARYHKQFGLSEDRIFPCIFSVDLDRFFLDDRHVREARAVTRARFAIPETAFLLLFSGKLASHKRPGDVVEAAKRLRHRGVWALLVGDGELKEALRPHAAETGCVVMTGFINQADLPRIYAAADLLVVPSSRDAHPLVVPEAMAMGIPAIVSDRVGCIGPSDHAQPGVNCLVHRCGDIEGLCHCIERLRSDPSLRAALSRGARETARLQSPTVAAGMLARALDELRAAFAKTSP